MSRWGEVEAAEPDFAGRVRTLFDAGKHKTVATLRRDGSPRISGVEAQFEDGDLWLGMMSGSLKALDLRRDPRLALHSSTEEPPEGSPSAWPGDAKIAGRAVEVTSGDDAEGGHRFRVEITEVVLTKVGEPADHLLIESWHPDHGHRVRKRH